MSQVDQILAEIHSVAEPIADLSGGRSARARKSPGRHKHKSPKKSKSHKSKHSHKSRSSKTSKQSRRKVHGGSFNVAESSGANWTYNDYLKTLTK